MELLIESMSPSEVLVSSKESVEFMRTLRGSGAFTITMVPSSSFNYSRAVAQLKRIHIDDSAHQFAKGDLKYLQVAGSVDMRNVASMRACGALLQHLTKKQLIQCPNAGGMLTRLGQFTLSDFMIIDAASLRSLDILRYEEHPSVVQGSGRPKEGFSLMTLLDRTYSTPGKRLLRNWLLKPLANVQEITARQDAVEYLISATHIRVGVSSKKTTSPIQACKSHLQNIRDIARSLGRIAQCVHNSNDWHVVRNSLAGIRAVMDDLSSLIMYDAELHGDHAVPPLVWSLIDCDETGSPASGARNDMERMLAHVEDVLDFEESLKFGTDVRPRRGIDAYLDDLRDRYDNLEDDLKHATDIVSRSVAARMDIRVHYMPQVGFVVGIQGSEASIGNSLPEFFEFMFEDGKKVLDGEGGDDDTLVGAAASISFFKEPITREMDATLGDIHNVIKDAEKSIMVQLESTMREYTPHILICAEKCSCIDVLLSLANVGASQAYVRPKITDAAATSIVKGRHPLVEVSCSDGSGAQAYIPNDIALGGASASCMVLSGANYSGKSVTMKMVGVMQIMAQIGCFVPAESATIGVVDRLFTRIESTETNLGFMESSFTLDVQQVSKMLKHATPRCMFLIDEFGKGTQSIDGVSLLAATIRHMSSQASGMPRTIATTHFLELFDYGLLGECANISFNHMVVDVRGNSDGDVHVTPLYRLEHGRSSKSYGVECAKLAGVLEDVVKRALEVLKHLESASDA